MARQDPKQLLRRSRKAWDDKEQYRSIMTDMLALTQPEKDTNIQRTKGRLHNDHIYASTLQHSHHNFANILQSQLTPPLQKWMQLSAGPRVPKANREEVELRLSDLRELFFAVVQASNFDTAAHEHYLEIGMMNGATLVQPSEDPDLDIQYTTPSQTQYALEEGANGKPIAVFRKFDIPANQLEMYWGDVFRGEGRKPDGWDQMIVNNPDKKFSVEEVTYWGFPDDRKIWYYDVLLKTSTTSVTRIVGRELKENPWVISRWSREPGSVYGRGPVMLALADAKVQNIVYKLLLMNASLAVQGIYTGVDDGIFNPATAKFVPGAIIPVGSNGGGATGPTLQALKPSYDLDLSAFILDDLDLRIRKAMLDEGLPPDTAAVRSATEIMERSKNLHQVKESPFGRLHQEWIRPITQKTLNVILAKGVAGFEDLSGGIRVDGQFIDVRVTAALAQGQQLSELDSFVRMVELSNALFGPEQTNLGVKVENSTEYMSNRLGVDPNMIRAEKERLLMQAQQEVQQQQLALEAARKGQNQEAQVA